MHCYEDRKNLKIVLGIGTGAVVSHFFQEGTRGFKLSVLAGGLGAFAGLLARDLLDITLGGSLGGAMSAAVIGAALSAIIINLLLGHLKR